MQFGQAKCFKRTLILLLSDGNKADSCSCRQAYQLLLSLNFAQLAQRPTWLRGFLGEATK